MNNITTPCISVVVPVYNVCSYVDECVKSIVEQTLYDIEIILVDDGSTDGSGKKCDDWAKKDSRITVIHKANGGLSDARNCGVNIAQADWIVFVDSDDIIHVELCTTVWNLLHKYKVDGVVYGYKPFLQDMPNLHSHIDTNRVELLDANCTLTKMFVPSYHINVIACNKLFAKVCYTSKPFPKGKLHEDFYVMPDIINMQKKIVYLDEALYFVRQAPGSITRRKYALKRLDELEGIEHVVKLLQDNDNKEALSYLYRIYLWKLCDHQMYLQAYFPQEKAIRKDVRNKFRQTWDNYHATTHLSKKDSLQLLLCRLVPSAYGWVRYKLKSNKI